MVEYEHSAIILLQFHQYARGFVTYCLLECITWILFWVIQKRVWTAPLKWQQKGLCGVTALFLKHRPLSLPATETLLSPEPCQSQIAVPLALSHVSLDFVTLPLQRQTTPQVLWLSLVSGFPAGSLPPAEQSELRIHGAAVHSHLALYGALQASFAFLARFLPRLLAPPPSTAHVQALPGSFALLAPKRPSRLANEHQKEVRDMEMGRDAPRCVTPSLGLLTGPQWLLVSPVAEELSWILHLLKGL